MALTTATHLPTWPTTHRVSAHRTPHDTPNAPASIHHTCLHADPHHRFHPAMTGDIDLGSLVVRQVASDEDRQQVTRILFQSFDALYKSKGMTMTDDRRAMLTDAAQRSDVVVLVCHERAKDGQTTAPPALATATLVPPTSAHTRAWKTDALVAKAGGPEPESWELRFLAVHPAAQGKGVAGQLVRAAERYVVSQGSEVVCLHTRRGMDHQERMYSHFGYQREQRQDLTIGEVYLQAYYKILT